MPPFMDNSKLAIGLKHLRRAADTGDRNAAAVLEELERRQLQIDDLSQIVEGCQAVSAAWRELTGAPK